MAAAASGLKNPMTDPTVHCLKNASLVVEMYDPMFLFTDDVRPASSVTWDTSEAVTQLAAGPLFMGLAGAAATVDEAARSDFPIITHIVRRVTVESDTFEVGDLIACDSDSSLLLDTRFKKTSVAAAAIGRAYERAGSATTTLLVEFFSRVLPHSPVQTTSATGVLGIALTSGVVFDANQTKLPGTAAADDMGLIGTALGTGGITLQGVDFGGTTADEKAGFEVVLPADYAAGGALTLKAHAGMLTTVSDGTATLDAEVFSDDGDGTVSADICATAAQSINSLTLATKSFTITPTGLVAGQRLYVRLSFAASDTGNLGVMIQTITKLTLDYARAL